MNRRTVLRTAGVAAAVSLSGCVEALREHYEGSFQGLVPIEIHSEADRHYNLVLEAYESGTNRQTYDESYTVTADQTVTPPHLDAVEQNLRATKFEETDGERTIREVTITPDTDLLIVRITDDDLVLDVQRGDSAERPSSTADPDGDGPTSPEDEPAPNETTDDETADDGSEPPANSTD